MASFEIAEAITGRNEGGYANNPSDTGGETYAGIARNHWPKWQGWKYIDEIKTRWKTSKDINSAIKGSPYPFEVWISDFYKKNFWDVLKLDLVNDQQLANSVYDFGVNSGTSRSAKFLQQSAGVKDDGIIGNQTLHAVNSADRKVIYYDFNKRREAFYKSIAKGNQAQFLKSWLSRLKPYK
jgi:lysozyme family protein